MPAGDRKGWTTNRNGAIRLAPPNVRAKYPPAEEDSFTFYLFRELIEEEFDKGMGPEEIAESARWFYNKMIRKASQTSAEDILLARKRMKAAPQIGKMYFFRYHAKHEKKLPYWDRFPLIFPIDPAKGGFLGINLHYLPSRMRIALMEKLYDLAANKSYTEQTKLKISYQILKGAAGLKEFKPCVKHYLFTQLRSPFIQVYYSEWAMACALPVQDFQKKSAETVWRDSRKRILG